MNEIGLPKDDLDTPTLWVDLDRLERNIESTVKRFRAANLDWRPHIKGVKTPAIAHKLIRAGAIGLTCAKLGEAEVMVQAGIDNLLIANEIVGPRKITRLVNLSQRADIKVAVDNPDNVAQMGQMARAIGSEVGILVEVNSGMNRAGVAPGEAAVELSKLVHEIDGLRYRGLMAWEGHTVGLQDADVKQQEIEKAIGLLTQSAEMCKAAGLPVDIVSGGGTGSYKITPTVPSALTEMQAGGVIFNDVTYRSWGVDTENALFVRTMVVSRPTLDRAIFDAGFKSLPAGRRTPEPVDLPGATSYKPSAEHGTVILDPPSASPKIGEAFDYIPSYTDSTLFLYNEIYGVRNGIVEAIWPISARGKLR